MSKYSEALINAKTLELYQCQKLLNQRKDLLVYVYKHRRYRSDTKQITSTEKLLADNWIKIHEYNHS